MLKAIIAETDESAGIFLKELLQNQRFRVHLLANDEDAETIFTQGNFQLFIVSENFEFPGNHSWDSLLNGFATPPVTIVTTKNRHLEHHEKLLHKGCIAVFNKPLHLRTILKTISSIGPNLDFWKIRFALGQEKEIRRKNKSDNPSFLNSESNSVKSANLFYNLHTSLNQGKGFGTMLSLLDLLMMSSQIEENRYIVDKCILDELVGNAVMGQKAIDTFMSIDNLLEDEIKLEEVMVSSCIQMCKSVIEELAPYADLKKQQIKIIEDNFFRECVRINPVKFHEIVYELVINALKYSPVKSQIYVLLEKVDDELTINIINGAIESLKNVKGIPVEYEKVVLNPFYRMTKTVQEAYQTLEFGLGLTLVDKVISKHEAIFEIFNFKDSENNLMVNAQISLKIKG